MAFDDWSVLGFESAEDKAAYERKMLGDGPERARREAARAALVRFSRLLFASAAPVEGVLAEAAMTRESLALDLRLVLGA